MLSYEQIGKNFEQLREQVQDNLGLRSYQMRSLREAIGAGRLDEGPRKQIETALVQHGLASTPLGTNQDDWVLIYERAQPIGDLIQAAAGNQPHADSHVRRAIKDLTGVDLGSPGHVEEELEETQKLRGLVDQIKALVSGA